MNSKKSNPLEELFKKLVFEDQDDEAEEENEEILRDGTEAEYEFGQTENTADGYEEAAAGMRTDLTSDNEQNAETYEAEDKTPEEENETVPESIIPDETENIAGLLKDYMSGASGEENEPEDGSEDESLSGTEISVSGENEEDHSAGPAGEETFSIIPDERSDEEKPEKKPIVFSGPVSDDAPAAHMQDADEEVFRNKRQSFSYRSTSSKKENRSSSVIRNPEDNIRYVRKESIRPVSETEHEPKKKHYSDQVSTKSDISVLETKAAAPDDAETEEKVPGFWEKLKSDLFGSRNVSERSRNLDVKSIPEVDYFSIDVEINDESEQKDSEKPEGFFKRINKSFERSAENSLDDYNKPGDASLILDDLYSLKTNLTIKFFIQLAAALVSIYLSAAAVYQIPVPSFISSIESPHRYSIAMFIVSALAMFSSFPMITSGLKNLFRKKADCDSLAAVSLTVCTIAAAISTESPKLISSGSVYLFAPVAITAFLANTMGKHLIVNRAINNFDALMSSYEKYSLIYVDDEAKAEQLTKGIPNDYPILAATRRTGFSDSFLKYSYSSDIADKLCRKFVPASLFISVLLTLISIVACSRTATTLNVTFITSMFSMFVSLCSCFCMSIVVNLPLASAAAEVEDNENIILGYQSIDDFYDTNSLIVDASQLFPPSSVKLCKLKRSQSTKIDDALAAAASLVIHSGSIFTEMFEGIINHDHSFLKKVENFSSEDSLGICGWIENKRVLFGTRQLMVNHNIEGIPSRSQEQEALSSGMIPLYLSVSGNIAAVFSVALMPDVQVAEQLSELAENGISLIVRNRDCAVTETRISRLFDLPSDMVKIIPEELCQFCDDLTDPVDNGGASVICNGKLSSVTNALSNIKLIHHSSLTGLVLQSTSAVIAIVFALVFMFIGMITSVSPLMIILYHTVWAFLTLFIMKVKPK